MPIPRLHRIPRSLRLRRSATVPAVGALLLAAHLLAPASPAAAQRPLDGVRMGLVIGGTGFVGVSMEYFRDDRALDLTVGTWSFRDVTVSVVGKELFGAAAFRPSVGAGLWLTWSLPHPENPDATRSGLAVLAGAPIGFDWRMAGGHYLGAHLHVSRGLWIRRTDPNNDTPLHNRFVPFPGLAYRWDPSR